jgi:hypothetical protein
MLYLSCEVVNGDLGPDLLLAEARALLEGCGWLLQLKLD